MNRPEEDLWNARHYDRHIAYVSALGTGLIDLLKPEPGERVIDLGCGTGDLTAKIAASGALAEGIDASADMIGEAARKYPAIAFRAADAQVYTAPEPVDAVFSNAALHWMKQPDRVAACVWDSLKPGGRFVAEFGGKGNIRTIADALLAELADRGIDAAVRNPWYFPGLGEYAHLLERQGFRVLNAALFDRPTPLADGDRGFAHWLSAFCGPFFVGIPESLHEDICRGTERRARPYLYSEETESWTADYVRLRILAVKPYTL